MQQVSGIQSTAQLLDIPQPAES